MKEINIDVLLDDAALNFVVGGEEFVVRDVTVETLLRMEQLMDESESARDGVIAQVKVLLGDKAQDLDIGVKAAQLILKEMTKFLYGAGAQEDATPEDPQKESTG